MKRFAFTALLGVACAGLAACGERETNRAENALAPADEFNTTATGTGDLNAVGSDPATASAAASWPREARIVEENGVTYRIDPDRTRVRLGENDARIVVENGVRYRVDPGGARVRIDERGLVVDVDRPDVDVDLPDVDAEVNGQ